MDDFIALNRLNWNDRAYLHATDPTGSYRIDEVIAGGDSLFGIEAAEIGDVSGRRLVHLQCHIGLDTISLAHRGAIATGLDFSEDSLAAARDFARRAGRNVRFVQSDLYDAPRALGATFEVAYVTWGAITWLPDIFGWGRVVADLLEPGGFLYFADTHPSAQCLDEVDGRLVASFDWRTPPDKPIVEDDGIDYTGDPRPIAHREAFNWFHPLSDILSALRKAGLVVEWLHEHELLSYRLFPMMEPAGVDALFRLPEGQPRLPLAFSLKAVKPSSVAR